MCKYWQCPPYDYLNQPIHSHRNIPLHQRTISTGQLQGASRILTSTWTINLNNNTSEAQILGDHLRTHPDKKFSGLILRVLEGGFRIGFQREKITLCSAKRNMSSATEHKEVVSSYLKQELKSQWIGVVGTQEAAQQLELLQRKGLQ